MLARSVNCLFSLLLVRLNDWGRWRRVIQRPSRSFPGALSFPVRAVTIQKSQLLLHFLLSLLSLLTTTAHPPKSTNQLAVPSRLPIQQTCSLWKFRISTISPLILPFLIFLLSCCFCSPWRYVLELEKLVTALDIQVGYPTGLFLNFLIFFFSGGGKFLSFFSFLIGFFRSLFFFTFFSLLSGSPPPSRLFTRWATSSRSITIRK